MLTLSGHQRKDADRVGGIKLMLPWPRRLGPEPTRSRPTNAHEHAWVSRQFERDEPHIVPVRSEIVIDRHPTQRELPERAWLGVLLIGYRWVHASVRRPPPVKWAQPSPDVWGR